MTKTIAISDDVHSIISEIQSNIKNRHGINLKMSYIVDSTLRNFVRNMEEILENKFEGITGITDNADKENVESKLGVKNGEDQAIEE